MSYNGDINQDLSKIKLEKVGWITLADYPECREQVKSLFLELNRKLHDEYQNDGSCSAEEEIEKAINSF